MADVHIDKLLNNPDFMALVDSAAQAVSESGASCTDAHVYMHSHAHACMHLHT